VERTMSKAGHDIAAKGALQRVDLRDMKTFGAK
jgi:hypothetical protein